MRNPGAWILCRAATRAVDAEVGGPLAPRRAAQAQSADLPLGVGADGIEVTRHEVPATGGLVPVYRYARAAGPRPAHIYLHGGSFWGGSAAQLDAYSREYVTNAGCTVLAPDYRLAPEHPYPAAPDDCHAVLAWATEHAGELGIDARRISIGGVSAGGCLAATVALMARDRYRQDGTAPLPMFLLLETPVLDLTLSLQSIHSVRHGVLSPRSLAEGYAHYVPDAGERRRLSPVYADDLSGLPPTLVISAQYDLLRDEDALFAQRAREAGVTAQLICARNHAHTTMHGGGPFFRTAPRFRARAAGALRAAYAAQGTGSRSAAVQS